MTLRRVASATLTTWRAWKSQAPCHGLRRLIRGELEAATGSLFRFGPASPSLDGKRMARLAAWQSGTPDGPAHRIVPDRRSRARGRRPGGGPGRRARRPGRIMKDQARVCRALCRTRVAAGMHQRRATRLANHLKLVLSIMGRAVRRAAPTGKVEVQAPAPARIATTSQNVKR